MSKKLNNLKKELIDGLILTDIDEISYVENLVDDVYFEGLSVAEKSYEGHNNMFSYRLGMACGMGFCVGIVFVLFAISFIKF